MFEQVRIVQPPLQGVLLTTRVDNERVRVGEKKRTLRFDKDRVYGIFSTFYCSSCYGCCTHTLLLPLFSFIILDFYKVIEQPTVVRRSRVVGDLQIFQIFEYLSNLRCNGIPMWRQFARASGRRDNKPTGRPPHSRMANTTRVNQVKPYATTHDAVIEQLLYLCNILWSIRRRVKIRLNDDDNMFLRSSKAITCL